MNNNGESKNLMAAVPIPQSRQAYAQAKQKKKKKAEQAAAAAAATTETAKSTTTNESDELPNQSRILSFFGRRRQLREQSKEAKASENTTIQGGTHAVSTERESERRGNDLLGTTTSTNDNNNCNVGAFRCNNNNAMPIIPGDDDMESIPVITSVEDFEIEESAVPSSSSASRHIESMTHDNDTILLQARIVEEPELAHAQPLWSESEGNDGTINSNASKRKLWVGGILAALVFLAVILVLAILLTQNDGGSDRVARTTSFLPEFTTQTIDSEGNNSPQGRALLWLYEHPEYDDMPSWRKRQMMALVTLYYSTGGGENDPAWKTIDPESLWLDYAVHECEWSSADPPSFGRNKETPNCTDDGAYQVLDLYRQGLQGQLPPELSFLSTLTDLALGGNKELTGSIPSQIGTMTSLIYLQLDSTQISGSLPTELGQLTTLANLILHKSRLSGSLPHEMGQMSSLGRLFLHGNAITGSIPSTIGGLASSLWSIQLENNHLTGTLPSELGLLTALTYVSLYNNPQLQGTLPEPLAALTDVSVWNLQNTSISGSFPRAFCEFKNYRHSFYVDCEQVQCDCCDCPPDTDSCECVYSYYPDYGG